MECKKRPRAEAPGLSPGSTTRVIAVWTLIQLLPLIASATRLPIWQNQPKPEESAALVVMLTTQLAIATLMAPLLLGDASRWLATSTVALPFLALASLLASARWRDAEMVAIVEIGWFSILAGALCLSKSTAGRSLITAAASIYVIGGAILFYVTDEFASPTSLPMTSPIIGPIFAGYRASIGNSPFCFVVLEFVAALALAALSRPWWRAAR